MPSKEEIEEFHNSLEVMQAPRYVDDRGALTVIYDHLQDIDPIPQINRVYVINNFLPNTIRAFHKHKENWDCFYIASGKAKVVVKPSMGKISNNEIKIFTLSNYESNLLIIPPYHWHGWESLSKDTVLINLCTESLDKRASKIDEDRVPHDKFGTNVWGVRHR